MTERAAKIQESDNTTLPDNIVVATGNGKLPSICPNCKGPLDFGPVGGDELICRNKCGFRFVEVFKIK